jgi:hypothetical protein
MDIFINRIRTFIAAKYAVLLVIPVTLIAAAMFYHGYRSQYFFVDEYEFLRKTVFFDLMFARRDFGDRRWYKTSLEDSAAQPKVGPYIYGLSLHLAGIPDIERYFTSIGFNDTVPDRDPWYVTYWMKTPTQFPPEMAPYLDLIYTGRRTALLFTAGTIGLTYLIGVTFGGPAVGLAAAGLLMTNRLFTAEGMFAMTDTMQLFFFALTLLLCLAWRNTAVSGRRLPTVVLGVGVGIAAALGAGVKVTGMLAFVFALVFFPTVAWFELRAGRRSGYLLLSVFAAGAAFAGLFFALHPFLWPDPINNFWFMYHERLLGAKTLYWRDYPGTAITSRRMAMNLIFLKLFAPDGGYGNFPFPPFPVDYALFVTGIGISVASAVKTSRETAHIPAVSALPVWTILVFGSLIAYLTNDWSRYYLPAVSVLCLVEAYPLGVSARWALRHGIGYLSRRHQD